MANVIKSEEDEELICSVCGRMIISCAICDGEFIENDIIDCEGRDEDEDRDIHTHYLCP